MKSPPAETALVAAETLPVAPLRSRNRHGSQLSGGLAIVSFWLITSLTAPLWRSYNPVTDQNLAKRLQSPSATHWFGTDAVGRDVAARVVAGALVSVPIATAAVVASMLIGTLVALGSITAPRPIAWILLRLTDLTLGFPTIVVALLAAAALGPGLRNVVIAVASVSWPEYSRLSRAQFLAARSRDHVKAARIIGCGPGRVLWLHTLPFAAGAVLVRAAQDLSAVVLAIAALSFIGLGVLPPQPEWGSMINDGRANLDQWWLTVFPGLAIASVSLAFALIGDGLRDRLDPRSAA